jgi:hypothetical protein
MVRDQDAIKVYLIGRSFPCAKAFCFPVTLSVQHVAVIPVKAVDKLAGFGKWVRKK